VGGNTLSNPSLSPFQAVMTATSDCGTGCAWNFDHNTEMTGDVANFIQRNIRNADPINCTAGGNLCTNPTIAGPFTLCSTASYTAQNVPSGYSLNWSSPEGTFVITGGQGTPNITIKSVGVGRDRVLLTLTNRCGESISLQTNISTGMPDVYGGSTYSANQSAANGEVVIVHKTSEWLELDYDKGFTSQTWTRNPASDPTFSIVFTSQRVQGRFDVRGSSPQQIGIVDVVATHECGTATGTFKFIWKPFAFFSLTASPNPANSSLTILTKTSNAEVVAKQEGIADIKISRVEITNKTGNIVFQKSYSPAISATSIDVSFLKSDIYTLRAYTGTQWLVKQITVLH
jgi:hypothetical protein